MEVIVVVILRQGRYFRLEDDDGELVCLCVYRKGAEAVRERLERMDETEEVRRSITATINSEAGEREALTAKYGQVWDSDQLRGEFEVVGFAAPFVVVRRNDDGVRGTLLFQHSPRYYFSFEPE